MISIAEAQPHDFKSIQEIAYKTWPVCYGEILSKPQLDFMLSQFYTLEALHQNVEAGHHFLLIKEGVTPLGFAAYEHQYKGRNVTRIHKIYILPDTQGKGLGRLMMDEIGQRASQFGSDALSLNVNRFNNSRFFYQKLGFDIVGEEDIPIGHGWLMEDYIMEKKL